MSIEFHMGKPGDGMKLDKPEIHFRNGQWLEDDFAITQERAEMWWNEGGADWTMRAYQLMAQLITNRKEAE